MKKLSPDAGTPAPYLSTVDAAKELGVAVRTVQLWVEAGILRAWKTAGGHRRIPRASVDELLAARARATGETPDEDSDQGLFRVLVVEDDPSLRMLFDMSLGSFGLPLQVDTAENGFAGLLAIGQHRPDLLISDLNMPGMDGFRMIAHLRASPQWRDLEVVVVTALGTAEIQARGGLPADVRVFGKPVPFAELEALLRERVAARAAAG